MATKIKKFYAVRQGYKIGIFNTWDECKKQVMGFKGATYKSFKTMEEAENYMDINKKVSSLTKEEIQEIDDHTLVAYVDGSFDVGTKQYGSGIVLLYKDQKLTFSEKGSDESLTSMRNVAGEIKGAEFAIDYAVKNNYKKVMIHYDYEGIEKWCTLEWKANKEGTKAYRDFYINSVKNIMIEFVKVKAHTGDKYNEEADILAKKSIGIGTMK